MKISMTGPNGQIGSRLIRYGVEPLSCDVRDRNAVETELHRVKPDIVIHLAGFSSVDFCENYYEEAVATNVFGTSVLCQVAHDEIGQGKVVLLSTDQVFDGATGNYKENSEPNPINNYGLTKVAAEGIVQMYDCKVIRISRCFNSNSKDISSYLKELKSGNTIQVPSHIFRSYCHTDNIVEAIYNYAVQFDRMPEILNIASLFPQSFYEFMTMVARAYGFSASLVCPRGEEAGYVPRPARCGLDVTEALRLGLPIHFPEYSVETMKNERL